jgi:hypothetical protein
MPLDDLVDLGYEVHYPPEGMLPPMGATVVGHGRHWNLPPDADEEAFVVEASNHAKIMGKLEQMQQVFSDNYANWPSMTNAQKDNANRQAQRGLANLTRHVRNDLTSEGD